MQESHREVLTVTENSNESNLGWQFWWFISLAIVGLFLFRPLDDVDFFTQLSLGRGAVELTKEASYYNLQGIERTANIGWLFQISMYKLYEFGGWMFIRVAAAILFAVSFLLPASYWVSSRKQKHSINRESNAAIVLGISLGILGALSSTSVRPQLMALFVFSFLISLIYKRTLTFVEGLLLFFSCIVWNAFHPSLLLGLVAIVAVFLFRITMSRKKGLILSSIALLCIVISAEILSFDTWRVFLIAKFNAYISRNLLEVSEWLPLWDVRYSESMYPVYLLLPLSMLACRRAWRRDRRDEVILSLVFALLSIYSRRFVLFWSVASIPVWIELFEGSSIAEYFNRFKAVSFKIAAAVLPVLSILVAPNLDPTLPIKAIIETRAQVIHARVYNYREWAGPLAFFGSPQWSLHVDGRLYLYDRSFWDQYYGEACGETPLDEIERKYRPDIFFLHKGFHAKLIALIERDNRWTRMFEGQDAVILRRKGKTADIDLGSR